MSLQVFSPHSHTHSNDPQSPYPCTPSTLCSSPLTQSGSGGDVHNQSYFGASHHQHQFLLREPSLSSSPNELAEQGGGSDMTMIDFHHRHSHRRTESGMIDSPEMPMSIRSPSMSTLGGTPDRSSPPHTRSPFNADKSSSKTSEMKSYPSAASIPIILAGLNGMKALRGERRDTETRHEKERSEDTLATIDSLNEDQNVQHNEKVEQRGSIGLGLGILQEPFQLIEERSISRSSAGNTTIQSNHSTSADQSHSTAQLHALYTSDNPMSELAAPRQDRADSWTSSLVSTGDDSVTSSTSSSSRRRPGTPDALLPSYIPTRLLPPLDGYAQGPAEKQSIAYDSVPDKTIQTNTNPPSVIRTSLKLEDKEESVNSPSQASEFSISAYNHSPHIPQEEEETRSNRWSNHAIEVKPARLSDSARHRTVSTVSRPFSNLQPMHVKEGTEEFTTPSAKENKKKKKQDQTCLSIDDDVKPKKEVKNRRRAVTLANPIEGEEVRKDLRRQSSPPMIFSARFVDQYVTLSNGRRRPTTAAAEAHDESSSSPSSFVKNVQERPYTAAPFTSGRLMSPSTLFKPLPALPSLVPSHQSPHSLHQHQSSLQSRRPGFLSVQTSPRKATFSRPGTASPAARSFGLVAPYTNLSPTYRDYRSLKSRESFSSLLDKNGNGSNGNRSRSTSVSSSISLGNKKKKKGVAAQAELCTGPPKYISFAIDQEGFREICPIFELVETIQQVAQGSKSSDGTNGGVVTSYRYLPIHAQQAYPFHHATMESPPVLRRLLIDTHEGKDFINKQSFLTIKHEGIYAVNGLSCKGEYNWRFEYKVMDRLNLIGKPIPGEKNLIPTAFTCSAGVLDPINARKRKAMDVVYKTLTSKLEALRVGDLPPECV